MVKCAECGFLALRNRFTGALDEAPREYREDGTTPFLVHQDAPVASRYDIPQYPYSGDPICFVQAYPVIEEVKWTEGKVTPEAVQAIVDKERDCRGLCTKWQQGFTPKEHQEMLDRQEWRNWQEKQRRADRKSRIIEVVVLVIGAGLFTLLGAWITRMGQSP